MKFIDTEKKGKGNFTYVLLFLTLAVGTAVGCIYLNHRWNNMGEGIKEYLSSLIETAKAGEDGRGIFKSSLISNLITLGIMFVMGFFRFGAVGTGIVIVRRGFVTGFTSASLIRAYGMKGILIMLTLMPTALIYIPALLIFGAASVTYSLKDDKFQKKIIFSYIFFTVFMISIFCVASLSEGFLTTTFMKLVSEKISQ